MDKYIYKSLSHNKAPLPSSILHATSYCTLFRGHTCPLWTILDFKNIWCCNMQRNSCCCFWFLACFPMCQLFLDKPWHLNRQREPHQLQLHCKQLPMQSFVRNQSCPIRALTWNPSLDLNLSSPSAISSSTTWQQKISTIFCIVTSKLFKYITSRIFYSPKPKTHKKKNWIPYALLQNLRKLYSPTKPIFPRMIPKLSPPVVYKVNSLTPWHSCKWTLRIIWVPLDDGSNYFSDLTGANGCLAVSKHTGII